MTHHPIRRRPLAVAALMLLAGYAQAQDFSLNSLTVDTQSGQTLGSLNRQGEVKRFFEVQKEVVFNTLRHLGLSPDELPPKLRQELEKPQTTNADAFALFARALDSADKGQFGVAGDLLRDAARIDPGFTLARGMSRLMPAISIPSGAERRAVQNLKQAALEQGKKTGQELNNSLNQKDQSFNKESESQQGSDKTRKQLGVLEKGEDQQEGEGEGGARSGLDSLGMSDSGGGDEGGGAPTGIESLAETLATTGAAQQQAGAAAGPAAARETAPAAVTALTSQIQSANENNLREDLIKNAATASSIWISLDNRAVTWGEDTISRDDRGGVQTPVYVVWRGHASNLLVNNESGVFAPGSGEVTLTFSPNTGTVTGELSDSGLGAGFDNRQGRGVFVQGNLFGGVEEQQEGAPFIFSSRSQYTRWEALISEKEFHDVLAHHYVGQWTADAGAVGILPVSTWVAGAVSASLPASGQVRYQGYASGVWRPADGAQYDLVSGLVDLSADFASREIRVSVENLSWALGGGLAGARPSAGFSLEGGMAGSGAGYDLSGDGARMVGNFFGADASETGGRWSLALDDGGVLWGIHSATSHFARGAASFNSGSLGSFGDGGVFAAGSPLAAWFSGYTYDGLWFLYGNFMAPGGVGNIALTDNTVGWRPIAGVPYSEWTLSGADLASFYAVDSSQTHHFSNAASYLQKTADDAFHRVWLVDARGALVEAYSGNIADTRPGSGITRFDFNQTALRYDSANPRLGQALHGVQSGEAGVFPGQMYVNWETGQVVGYNVNPGVGAAGGVGVFLGVVDADTPRIQGSWLARGYRQTVDEADSPRWMTDASGVTLDLYGHGGVSAAAGVFDAVWQDERLDQASANPDGRAQIIALASGNPAVSVAPGADELWNGFAVGHLVERQSGERLQAVNNDAEDVAIRLNRSGGHASVEMQLDSGAGAVEMDMTGEGSDSAYVSPKAFAVVKSSPTPGGAATPDFLAATPELTGRDEAARYDYTSWGVWGGDFREGKDLTATPNSMWVAGKLTQTVDMPVSGRAEYSGQVLGQVTGAQTGFVRGNLAMSVDFGNRSVGGNLNDLRVIGGSLFNQSGAANGALWIDRASLNGGWNAGTQQYSATLTGKDVVSGAVRGAFFGPQALETGGRWNISTQGSTGAGIYVGKRGAINP